MNDRYFGKIVAMTDKFTLVMNKGSEHGVELGDKFMVVGLGQSIVDSDTQEELGRLEILRGNVSVVHVQERIATARSCKFDSSSDAKGFTTAALAGGSEAVNLPLAQGAVTKPIKPAEEKLKELDGAQIGDYLIKL